MYGLAYIGANDSSALDSAQDNKLVFAVAEDLSLDRQLDWIVGDANRKIDLTPTADHGLLYDSGLAKWMSKDIVATLPVIFKTDGSRDVTGQLTSTYAAGAPMVIADNTMIANLNADLLDGNHASAFALAAHTHTFLNLTDAPASYASQGLKLVRVNAGETGLEFTVPVTTTFLALTDVPATYASQASKVLMVNVGETAVEFLGPWLDQDVRVAASPTFGGLTVTGNVTCTTCSTFNISDAPGNTAFVLDGTMSVGSTCNIVGLFTANSQIVSTVSAGTAPLVVASDTQVDNLRSEFVGQISGARLLSHMQFFNGTFLQTFDALITSDGATITMSVEQSGGGDLTMFFSSGQSEFDCTPAATITLTAGTDTVPKMNWIYILESTKALTKSTSGWPSDVEHIRVGVFRVQSASLVQSGASGNDWAIINQNWNDHAADHDGQGHETDITELLRHGGPGWRSGCEGVVTQDGNDLWVSVAAGLISQMHVHTFDAQDSDTAGAGDPIVVINDPDANFARVNSLNSITKLSDGDAIGNNKWVKFVLWVVINKTGSPSIMMLNLPSEFYNTQADAETDVQGYANFTIPDEFSIESSTGFLIASFVCKHTATAMQIGSTQNLRGRIPFNVSGSGTGGGDVTAATTLTDNALLRGDGGAKGAQGSSWLLGDNDNMLVPGAAELRFSSAANKIWASDLAFLDLEGQARIQLGVDGTVQLMVTDGTFEPATDNDIDIGTLTKRFKDGFFAGSVTARNLVALLFASTANDTVENTASQVAFAPTGVGSMELPADSLVVGQKYRLRASGILSTV